MALRPGYPRDIVGSPEAALAETTFKTLIDRFRSRPEWQHADPAVRAEAVLRLPASDHELVLALAREDADARVRRAAVKRLSEAAVLAEIAGGDSDLGVREEAAGRLVHVAVHEQDEAQARAAVLGLRDAKHLASVAKGAVLAAVREAALHALADAKSLASVVREAPDPRTRLLALGRIEDGATLLGLAQNLEQKALAVAAVDRLSDPDALEAVAAKARVPAAARRARARLETGEPAVPATAPPVAARCPLRTTPSRHAYEEARAALEREAAGGTGARGRSERRARGRDPRRSGPGARDPARGARGARAEAEALAALELVAAQAAFRELAGRWREAPRGLDAAELGSTGRRSPRLALARRCAAHGAR